jgi:DNA-directed RNA polymerase specialized sigma24 family protein
MVAPGAREELEDLLALPGLMAALPALEREVILLRFFQDLDQYEIAARVGCSQMHISRLQRRALARMRAQLVESKPDLSHSAKSRAGRPARGAETGRERGHEVDAAV